MARGQGFFSVSPLLMLAYIPYWVVTHPVQSVKELIRICRELKNAAL